MRSMVSLTIITDENTILKTELSVKALWMILAMYLLLYLVNTLLKKFPLIMRDKDTKRVNYLRAVHAKSYASTVHTDQLALFLSTSLAILKLLPCLAPTRV